MQVALLRAENAQQKESELRLATDIQRNEQDAQMMRIGTATAAHVCPECCVFEGTTAVNHEAKRAISNTMTWMDELDGVIVPKLEMFEPNQAVVRELMALAQQVL